MYHTRHGMAWHATLRAEHGRAPRPKKSLLKAFQHTRQVCPGQEHIAEPHWASLSVAGLEDNPARETLPDMLTPTKH